MPLRDHFRAPIDKHTSWEGFHAMWPAMLVIRLVTRLPQGYSAEPRVHLGAYYEVDVGAFERDEFSPSAGSEGGVATLPYAAPVPTSTIDADLGEQYEYEVLVYDQERGRHLVAAIEFVSPANKDRPDHRRAFVSKCAALLQKNVCVAIVDLVTTRRANLYAELLEFMDRSDPGFELKAPSIYAVTCHTRLERHKPKLDFWAYSLKIGEPLPELPLWLAEDVVVQLDLDASYEDTCRILGIDTLTPGLRGASSSPSP